MDNNVVLENHYLKIKIDAWELVSIKYREEELIHQKDEPGWGNSDTEMFPVIWPTVDYNFVVPTSKGNAVLDQHWIARELDYELIEQWDWFVCFQKKYRANTKVKNSKFPKKSRVEFVYWPYDFVLSKKFILSEKNLEIIFEIESEMWMQYMFWYHPAFKLDWKWLENIEYWDQNISIDKIIEKWNDAYPVFDTNKIKLIREWKINLLIDIQWFNNFMLWSPLNSMICIEPITFYPYFNQDKFNIQNFKKSTWKDIYKVLLNIEKIKD